MTVLAVGGGCSLSVDVNAREAFEMLTSVTSEYLRRKKPLRFEGDLGRLLFEGDEPRLVRNLGGEAPRTAWALTGMSVLKLVTWTPLIVDVDGEDAPRWLVVSLSFSINDFFGVFAGRSALISSCSFSARLPCDSAGFAKATL